VRASIRGIAACALTIAMLVVTTAARGQEKASFTVASVKRNVSGLPYDKSTDPTSGLDFVNERLRDVILFAYGLNDFQLTGDPAWVSRDRFDIAARADGPLSIEEKRVRLRQLLADRFGLRVRNEMREQPVYALTRSGSAVTPGLRRRDCSAPGIAGLACERGIATADAGIVRMGGISLARLAHFLGGVLGRVVLDETRLTGTFDVDLRWRADIGLSPDLSQSAKAEIETRPALPVALREQLGLELHARRAPVTVVVVESIKQPTPD
jgi:uncharacterized protein (TIGR03435 family)